MFRTKTSNIAGADLAQIRRPRAYGGLHHEVKGLICRFERRLQWLHWEGAR